MDSPSDILTEKDILDPEMFDIAVSSTGEIHYTRYARRPVLTKFGQKHGDAVGVTIILYITALVTIVLIQQILDALIPEWHKISMVTPLAVTGSIMLACAGALYLYVRPRYATFMFGSFIGIMAVFIPLVYFTH